MPVIVAGGFTPYSSKIVGARSTSAGRSRAIGLLLNNTPGISLATAADIVVTAGRGGRTNPLVLPDGVTNVLVDEHSVRPGYFKSLGIPLLQGRVFE